MMAFRTLRACVFVDPSRAFRLWQRQGCERTLGAVGDASYRGF